MSSSSGEQSHEKCIYKEWMTIQELDLSELLTALQQTPDPNTTTTTTTTTHDPNLELSRLVQKGIDRFQHYIDQRRRLYCTDASAFFSPTWCTSLENSLLWIAGCRPTSFIRLVYTLCRSNIESRLGDYLQGVQISNLSDLSAKQLSGINGLQSQTIREEEKLSSQLASLQEDIADQPIALIVTALSRAGEPNGEAERALDEHVKAMASVIEEADKLRITTFQELLSILTPIQGVEFLAGSKQLHLCMRAWGTKRDHSHGR